MSGIEIITSISEEFSFGEGMSVTLLVGGSRGPNKPNRNIMRQINKFGIIVFCKILINI